MAERTVNMIAFSLALPQAEKNCPIHIGLNIFANPQVLTNYISGRQVLIVTQQSIATYFLSSLQELLKDYQVDVFYLADGEQHKNIDSWQQILNFLVDKKHDRSTTLIAFGGGVVGDITGFAAGCYLRGVNYIQVPTSLIAQVDSAIGGKTAVNHASGKNLIGLFYQPRCVIADPAFLKTLPEREFISGLAEIIKYGLILDAGFFAWLENNIEPLLQRDSAALLHAIHISAKTKADIVSQDEKETGIRSLLNFGHTFGHAIEVANHYKNVLHGEAVAEGMRMAAALSLEMGLLEQADFDRIQRLLLKINFNKDFYIPTGEELIKLMLRDKKTNQNQLNLILLKAIGQAQKYALDPAQMVYP